MLTGDRRLCDQVHHLLLRDNLKKRFDRFAVLQRWNFADPAQCKFSVERLDKQGSQIPEAIEGRRKAFAEWVASANNPLTTRTIANRIWLWHFGQPLAGNPNNFGSTGKKPDRQKNPAQHGEIWKM